jgi:lysozyme family protein
MKDNFKNSLEHVLVHEGGWADHPKDPGGATIRVSPSPSISAITVLTRASLRYAISAMPNSNLSTAWVIGRNVVAMNFPLA